MSERLLSAAVAAEMLGVSVTTLYDWLSQSDYGLLKIRGASVVIDYLQGGSQGQGRIRVTEAEVLRLRELMRVRRRTAPLRRPPTPRMREFPGIDVPLGRPDGTSRS